MDKHAFMSRVKQENTMHGLIPRNASPWKHKVDEKVDEKVETYTDVVKK